jgi:hypothetical protein
MRAIGDAATSGRNTTNRLDLHAVGTPAACKPGGALIQ